MSSAEGAVKFADGEIWWYEYNGTSDIVVSHIYKEMAENWRNHEWKTCECDEGEEVVEGYSSYGGGFYFKGLACRKCHSLKGVYSEADKYYDPELKIIDGAEWANTLEIF